MWLLRRGANYNVALMLGQTALRGRTPRSTARGASGSSPVDYARGALRRPKGASDRAGVWGRAPREEDSCEEIRMFLRD
jgi:hypothetical protein